MRASPLSIPRQASRAFSVLVQARKGGLSKAQQLAQAVEVPTVTKLEWQQPLGIIKYPDPRLRTVNARIGVFDASLLKLATEMIRLMYLDDGVGLAAPQVGVNLRLMVFNPDGRDKPGNESILVNPEIVSSGPELGIVEEGCLSFPGLHSDVERPLTITVRAQNQLGETVELKDLTGWLARIFQHEFDHLQGVLFHDRMNPTALDVIRPGLGQLEEEYMAAHPGERIKRIARGGKGTMLKVQAQAKGFFRG